MVIANQTHRTDLEKKRSTRRRTLGRGDTSRFLTTNFHCKLCEARHVKSIGAISFRRHEFTRARAAAVRRYDRGEEGRWQSASRRDDDRAGGAVRTG